MPDYSFPSWILPKQTPFEALLQGIQAGSQIAATRQRGMALAQQARQQDAQLHHQALQDQMLQTKWQNDVSDMQTIQEWWPKAVAATGEELYGITTPALRNPEMMSRMNTMLLQRKQLAATTDFANAVSTVDGSTPEGQAILWGKSRGLIPPERVQGIIDRQVTAKTNEKRATETARHNAAMETRTSALINVEAAAKKEAEAYAIQDLYPEEADALLQQAKDLREALPGQSSQRQEFEKFYDAKLKRWFQWRNNVAYPITKEEAGVSPSVEANIIKSQITDLEKSLDALPGAGTVGEKNRGTEPQRKALESQLDKLRKDRDALRHPSEAAPAATSGKKYFNPETGEVQDTPYAPR